MQKLYEWSNIVSVMKRTTGLEPHVLHHQEPGRKRKWLAGLVDLSGALAAEAKKYFGKPNKK